MAGALGAGNSQEDSKSPEKRPGKTPGGAVENGTTATATNESPSPKKTKKKKAQKLASQQQLEAKPQRIVFNIYHTQYEVIGEVGKHDFNWKLSNRDPWYTQIEWDIQWTDVAPPLDRWKDMKPFQKINHFPGMYQIARKNYLASNLNRMQKQFPADFQFFPKTWLLPHQLEDLKNYSAANPGANFIVKPEALSQGKGIFITKRFDQIDMSEHLVVQKYIKHPYLLDEYKFDFRIYVLVTNVQPLRIFAFRDGLARLATEKYKQKAYNNPFIHLTNYAINKDNASFKADASADATTGHKRTLESVLVRLAQDGVDVEALQAQMRDIVVKTLISVQPDLYHHYRTSQPSDIYNNMCFEILGFDILIDKTGKPWLLEVNHAPSFNCDTALDAKVKRHLIHDTFNLLNATIEEKNDIIALLKDMHEKRVIGINKTNKQAFYAQRQELQQTKLLEHDAYQLANLGRFERLFPPMKQYVKAQIPVEAPAAPTSDPLAMKLWKLDNKLAAASQKEEQDQQQDSMADNSIDEKLTQYYSVFLGISKSLNSEVKIANKQKQIEQKQKAAQAVPAKAPMRKREVKIPEPIKKEATKQERTTAQADEPQEKYKQLEEESLASSRSSDPGRELNRGRVRQYHHTNKYYTEDNPQMGEFNEQVGEEQRLPHRDAELDDQSEQEWRHARENGLRSFPKGQSFSNADATRVQHQGQQKRSLESQHTVVLRREGSLPYQQQAHQEPGPFSVVSLTRAHTKPRAGLQDRLHHKDSASVGLSAHQDPRRAVRSLAGMGNSPAADDRPGLHPVGSVSEAQARSQGIRGMRRIDQEQRRAAGLADQLGDQMSHLASLPLQPHLVPGQPPNLHEQARGLRQTEVAFSGQSGMVSDASRYKLTSLKVPRGKNLTDAELSEQEQPSQYAQHSALRQGHRLQAHIDMLESQRQAGLSQGSTAYAANPEARSHSEHASQLFSTKFEQPKTFHDQRSAVVSPQLHQLKSGGIQGKPRNPDAYRYHMDEGALMYFAKQEPALKFPQIDGRDRGRSSQNRNHNDSLPLGQSLGAAGEWRGARDVDRYIKDNHEVLPAHSHVAFMVNHRSPPIPKLQKFRKDPPRINPMLNNELMIHGYSDKFQSRPKEEQVKVTAKASPEHHTPTTYERMPALSPKPAALVNAAKTSEPIKAPQWERSYQSGSKKTIYFSCDINEQGPPASQSVGPSRRSTIEATAAATSAARARERLHASLDIEAQLPADAASTPSKGLKGTKVKSHHSTNPIKKLIPQHH